MITADKWAQARALGFGDDELLEVVEEDYPDYSTKIKKARSLGFSNEDIVNELNDIITNPPQQPQQPQQSKQMQQPQQERTAASTLVEASSPQKKEFTEEGLYRPRELTPEQLKKMSFKERLEYADELNLYRDVKRSKGITKGIASGLTFGLSEQIPFLKPQEGEHGQVFGEFMGSVLPIHGLFKIFGAPLVRLAGTSPKFKSGLEAFARMTGMGISGGLYEEGKEAGKEWRMPTPDGFLKHAESWAAFDALLQSTGLVGRMARRAGQYVGSQFAKTEVPIDVSKKINDIVSRVNLAEKNPETLRKEIKTAIDEVFPERIDLSPEQLVEARQQALDIVDLLPEGNRKKVAMEAVNRDIARTPDQMENFLEEYDAYYPGLKGDLKDKNRKMLNRWADRNVRERDIRAAEGEQKIKGIEVTDETKLQQAKTELKQAGINEDKAAIKEARRKVDLLRKKIEKKSQSQQAKESKAKEETKQKDRNEAAETDKSVAIRNNIQAMQSQLEKVKKKPESDFNKEKITTLETNIKKQNDALRKMGLKEEPQKQYKTEKEAETTVESEPETETSKQQEEEIESKPELETEPELKPEPEVQAKGPDEVLLLEEDGKEVVKVPYVHENGMIENKTIELTPEEQVISDAYVDALKRGKAKESIPIGKKLREAVFKRVSAQARPSKLEIKKKQESEPPKKKEPIEEEGMTVEESLESPKTAYDKAYDALASTAESVKNPVESSKEIVKNVNTAVFNALAPLERLETNIPVSERPSTALKQAKTATSEINSVMEFGAFNNATNTFDTISLREGYAGVPIFKFKKETFPGEFSIEELNEFRKAKITLKRQAEGKKVGVSTQDARKTVQDLRRYEPLDKKIRQFQQETLQFYGKDTLGEDLIKLWNSDYYAPLYRVMDSGEGAIFKAGSLQPKKWIKAMKGSERKSIPPSESDLYNLSMLVSNHRKNQSVLNYKKGVESGELPGTIRKGQNNKISDGVLQDLDIDPKLKRATENLYSQTRKDAHTPSKNVLRGWENGKPFEIAVPEEVFQSYQTLTPVERGFLSRIMLSTKNAFSKGIARSTKLPSIIARDFANAWLTSTNNHDPRNVVKGIFSAIKRDKDYQKFVALGGDAYAQRLTTRVERAKSLDDLITPGRRGPIVPFNKLRTMGREFIRKVDDISMAVPLTEYKAALKKYGDTPNGRTLAILDARSVTYDPTRKGSSNRLNDIGSYFPFFNVSLQELDQVMRNTTNPIYWAKGLTAISVPTIMLKMHNDANPDYQSLNEMDKLAFWHIYPTDGSHYRIPIPWLHGVLFKSGAEAAFDLAKGLGGDAWKAMFSLFLDNVSGDMAPLAQGFAQATLGKTFPSPFLSPFSFFFGAESKAPDVIPRRLENFPPEKQYTSKTSHLARKFGDLWGISPLKIEAVAKSMGGVAVQDALNLTDEIVYWSGLAEDKRPEKHYLSILGFEKSSTPSRTKDQARFYEIMEKQRQQKAIKERPEGLDLSRYNTQISKLFRQYRDIEDASMDPKEKRELLNEKQRAINELYHTAVQQHDKSQ